ncbi:hypothetical protein [Pinisolibacter sp.]|uniref:hypothetical protein n=1 Tax=Pinisolibacter sp. TaxID=2172024 RepID=UPI002FDDDA7B
MRTLLPAFAALAVLAIAIATPAAAAGVDGMYKRPNGTTAKVWTCGGKLCATVQESKFNMFLSGIAPAGEGTWKGDMKHPDMPGFMTFNGTVTTTGKGLKVQGCAVGQSMCDAENWTKQ